MNSDRREAQRSSLSIVATICIDGTSRPCRLRNISATGAQVALESPVDEGTEVILEIENYGFVKGRAVWRGSKDLGIKFDDESKTVENILLGLSALPSAY